MVGIGALKSWIVEDAQGPIAFMNYYKRILPAVCFFFCILRGQNALEANGIQMVDDESVRAKNFVKGETARIGWSVDISRWTWHTSSCSHRSQRKALLPNSVDDYLWSGLHATYEQIEWLPWPHYHDHFVRGAFSPMEISGRAESRTGVAIFI